MRKNSVAFCPPQYFYIVMVVAGARIVSKTATIANVVARITDVVYITLSLPCGDKRGAFPAKINLTASGQVSQYRAALSPFGASTQSST
jgi:hypothetical protein